ncbi:hypothetical protein NDU88_008637 [Pleurodeles waltl]|uniref:Receptor ligand binding region domain-containing protein n=1 Tax=Pleurodeles waltl TaxID=8319 RepID=A0AAV7NZJ3_PLEWA|nr:hypothetical protein NDU88_008637 [Pleurodeles waltl]
MQPGCRLQAWTQESYSLNGDILIGGVFVVHSGYSSPKVTLEEEPKQITCEGFNIRYYRDLLAMVFAAEEINQSPDLLPNITLGVRIFDSCMSESKAGERILGLLHGKSDLIPGYRCPAHPPLAGVIGETMSSLSVPMARIMGLYHFPQVKMDISCQNNCNLEALDQQKIEDYGLL